MFGSLSSTRCTCKKIIRSRGSTPRCYVTSLCFLEELPLHELTGPKILVEFSIYVQTTLRCKLYEGGDFCLFCSLLYLQCPEQWGINSNIHWMNILKIEIWDLKSQANVLAFRTVVLQIWQVVIVQSYQMLWYRGELSSLKLQGIELHLGSLGK